MRSIDEKQSLFIVEHFHKHPGFKMPVMMPLVCTSKGNVLISPVCGLSKFSDQLGAIGGVQHIIAPNLVHHLGLSEAFQLYPNAQTWCATGLEKKRSDLKWTGVLNNSDWLLESELESLLIEGARGLNEIVFFHPESKTLILTDLCFNIQNPQGFMAGFILRLMGTHKRFAVSRLLRKFISDRAAFITSLTLILDWDFEKILVSHGEPVLHDARNVFISAFQRAGYL